MSASIPDHVLKLWDRSQGQAWEPPNPEHPSVLKLIEDGWLRRTDGRCGFERFKDSMLAWTPAARAALQRAKEGA